LVPPSRPATFQSLRIALVCPYSLSRPGGVQGQVVGLARALDARGHKVTVFAPVDGSNHVPPDIDLVSTGPSVSLPSNGSIAPVSVWPRALRRARASVTTGGFDVVHVHEPFTPGLPYGLLVGRGLPPLVATFHRSGPSLFYPLLRPCTRQRSSRFSVQCAVSEAARETASKAVRGTCHVTFNGVEVDRYQRIEPWPSDRPTVLFLGRHEERKGLVYLLEAWTRLGDRAGDAAPHRAIGRPRLWVAGDGPLTDMLRRHHPDSPDLEWLGVLTEEEKIRRLVAADVLCAPSLGGESFGMVLLEALAARTVVVASDIGGYRDAAGGHAVLVQPGDTAGLAAALTGVLAGESAVAPMGGYGESAVAPMGGYGEVSGAEGRSRWLDAGARRAGEFAMVRLAECYEGHYRAAMVGRSG
jgi:phosphatidyl-myo-inositol alpha-mannosyltransferase